MTIQKSTVIKIKLTSEPHWKLRITALLLSLERWMGSHVHVEPLILNTLLFLKVSVRVTLQPQVYPCEAYTLMFPFSNAKMHKRSAKSIIAAFMLACAERITCFPAEANVCWCEALQQQQSFEGAFREMEEERVWLSRVPLHNTTC